MFQQYRDFGYIELNPRLPNQFAIYKGLNDYKILSIPVGWGDIGSAFWQGSSLIVTTTLGESFVFSDFYNYQRISSCTF